MKKSEKEVWEKCSLSMTHICMPHIQHTSMNACMVCAYEYYKHTPLLWLPPLEVWTSEFKHWWSMMLAILIGLLAFLCPCLRTTFGCCCCCCCCCCWDKDCVSDNVPGEMVGVAVTLTLLLLAVECCGECPVWDGVWQDGSQALIGEHSLRPTKILSSVSNYTTNTVMYIFLTHTNCTKLNIVVHRVHISCSIVHGFRRNSTSRCTKFSGLLLKGQMMREILVSRQRRHQVFKQINAIYSPIK